MRSGIGDMKWFYEVLYRYFRAPWDIGPREELVALVESGRIQPCRTIDLGSGTASNCIFLAQHGFEVTGVDYSEAAVKLGRKRAQEAGVSNMAMLPGEAERRFGPHFEIERIAGKIDYSRWPSGYAVYLMTRKAD